MKKYEYKVIESFSTLSVTALNQHGNNGWELVSVTNFHNEHLDTNLIYTFKREIIS